MTKIVECPVCKHDTVPQVQICCQGCVQEIRQATYDATDVDDMVEYFTAGLAAGLTEKQADDLDTMITEREMRAAGMI